MACTHPPEERLRVYEGTATPRPDRALCGLCGELLYLVTAHRPQLTWQSASDPAP